MRQTTNRFLFTLNLKNQFNFSFDNFIEFQSTAKIVEARTFGFIYQHFLLEVYRHKEIKINVINIPLININ